VVVKGGGDGVVALVGLQALGSVADRVGLGDSLSAAVPLTGKRAPVRDRGKVLIQATLMLAGGVEARPRSSAPVAGEVVSHIDASLREIHSENKQGTTQTYDGGFGFHQIYCTSDATGETLGVKLRPGTEAHQVLRCVVESL